MSGPKVYNRLLVPLTAADQAQAPPELRAALSAVTRHVEIARQVHRCASSEMLSSLLAHGRQDDYRLEL
jgi:hypothetical protein